MADFSERDVAAIRDMVDTHIQSILDHNPDWFLATCTDDITFLPPELPPLVGRAACRTFLEEFPTPATFHVEDRRRRGRWRPGLRPW